MFWADQLAEKIEARFGRNKHLIVRDEKTLSGRVHMGSMRGLAVHGAASEALTKRGIKNTFLWEHNDFDPFDSVPPPLSEEKFKEHLGKPLFAVPSPEPGFANYAEYFAADFAEAHKKAAFSPEYYWTYKDLYKAGKMDECIKTALTEAPLIRKILKEVSGSQKDDTWLPVSIVCENCGKIMTTRAYDFDGTTVAYACDKNLDNIKGCGHTGRISPFGGNAKLFWKVDWASKWIAMEVDVEGGGKDHSTKGGARDVANHIAKEVFKLDSPFDIPYEFLLVGGKKMSTSKGRGISARQMADLLPTNILRLALLGKDYNQQINFDPEGDTIPTLYDQYDKLAESYWAGTKDDYANLFEYLHPQGVPKQHFLPRFSQVAFMVQMSHLNLEEEIAKLKGGALTPEDKKELEERAQYAKKWLEEYAPEKFVFKLQDTLPEGAKTLTDIQKQALLELKDALGKASGMPDGETIHHALHDMKEKIKIAPSDLFSAVYLAFLGKTYGPKAGWFLSVLDKDFVVKRLQEASR